MDSDKVYFCVVLKINRDNPYLIFLAWKKEDAHFGAGESTKRGISVSIELVKQ